MAEYQADVPLNATAQHGVVRSPNKQESPISDPESSLPKARRPYWPEPAYDVTDEMVDPSDWSLNPSAALPPT